jgi:hypothetical protein
LRDANARLQAEAGRRAELEARLEAAAARSGELATALRDGLAAGDRLRAERDALLRSTSWRLTAPLRALGRSLSRARRALRGG